MAQEIYKNVNKTRLKWTPSWEGVKYSINHVLDLKLPAPVWPNVRAKRLSAVLVTLFEKNGEPVIVFTKRNAGLKNHPGEVSFPGGGASEGETPPQTAIREAQEEIGLSEPARVLGTLDYTFTGSGLFVMVPVVAVLNGPPRFRINLREVERIISVPLADLTKSNAFASELWEFNDYKRQIYSFSADGEIIWGATARILVFFLNSLAKLNVAN
jgi:8-oxo-dGTP pyrophosphatase MutT (NUDIX family)